MEIPEMPEYLYRFPTRAAIESLAERFGLENQPGMQDWEYEVADPERAREFAVAYKTAALTDDERFTLMEMILQSFEERPKALADDPAWLEVVRLIEKNIDLHISTVWYWASIGDIDDAWRVTPFMRDILARHVGRFVNQEA